MSPITLRDTIEINTPAKEIYSFFLHFQENYLAWHPEHIACRYMTDGPLGLGSIIYIEENLHGNLHKLKMRITRLDPYSSIEYQTFMGTRGLFIFDQKTSSSTLFTAELHMGLDIPVLGKLLDPLLRLLLPRQLKDIQQHMKEEGENCQLCSGRNDPGRRRISVVLIFKIRSFKMPKSKIERM